MKKRTFPLSEVYRLLEPGPVVLFTTIRAGRPNVMPRSWHWMMELTPTLVGCVVSNRNYSFASLKASRECVINIPTFEFAKIMVACGNTSGREVHKFNKFGLTPVAASRVEAPLHRRMFCQPGVQGRGCEAGHEIQLLHHGSRASLDRSSTEKAAKDSSSRRRRFHAARPDTQNVAR